MSSLKTGDYIINSEIIIERKTRDDFIQSIIQGRLFAQCSRLKKMPYHAVLLIEGNPYKTNHDIDRQAIKGALLSVSISWKIPIVYSANPNDSADMLLMTARQFIKEGIVLHQTGYKPKKLERRAVYFLTGLPSVGPSIATSLLQKFGTIENIILATEDELLEIEGLGKTKVKRIRDFLGKGV